MKKATGLLIAGLTISTLMTGCNKPAEGDNANAPATTSGTAAPTTPPATPGATTPGATTAGK